jgi:hypothetical protein
MVCNGHTPHATGCSVIAHKGVLMTYIGSNMPMPRFRGNTIEVNGKHEWEMIMTFVGDGDDGLVIHSNDQFDTKQLAIDDMMQAIQLAIKEIADKCNISTDEACYIDMKTNSRMRFDKKDRQ